MILPKPKQPVPNRVTVIKEKGIYFNHLGYLIHSQTNRLAILPSLLDIERYEHARPRTRAERLTINSVTSKTVKVSSAKLSRKKKKKKKKTSKRKKTKITTIKSVSKKKKKQEEEE